jgi:receptor-type tyrosine-protein phosphatase beta
LSLPQSPTEKEISNLSPGEKYIIRVNTVSYRAEPSNPQQIIQTVRPTGISQVKQFVDSSNITLSWDRPAGRIESYTIKWMAMDRVPVDPDREDGESPERIDEKSELLQGEKVVTQDVWGDQVKIPIFPLMSGVAYSLRVETTSYGMNGDEYNTTIRTREFYIQVILSSNFYKKELLFK